MLSVIFKLALLALFFFNLCSAQPLRLGKRHSHIHKTVERRETFGRGTKVTNSCAYNNNNNPFDGPATANTPYKYFTGSVSSFPAQSQWISFDAMFEANRPLMKQSCGWNAWGEDNTDHLIDYIHMQIQNVARDSKIDHRAILAVIMQESGGCLHVPTTNNGVMNPGIMQSHNGVAFNAKAPVTSIKQMIIDGTQGTAYGDGLVQLVNRYGDYFSAFRAYNSGSIAPSGDLSDANGATGCYVSDIANRLLGWTLAPTTCLR